MNLDVYYRLKDGIEKSLDKDGYRYETGSYVIGIHRGTIVFIDPLTESKDISKLKEEYDVLKGRLIKILQRTLEGVESIHATLNNVDLNKLSKDGELYQGLLYEIYSLKNDLDDELNVFTGSRG